MAETERHEVIRDADGNIAGIRARGQLRLKLMATGRGRVLDTPEGEVQASASVGAGNCGRLRAVVECVKSLTLRHKENPAMATRSRADDKLLAHLQQTAERRRSAEAQRERDMRATGNLLCK